MSKKRVCLLTTFMDLPSGYGLVPVVLDQLKMLVKNGYKPALFTMEGFEKHEDATRIPSGVEIKPFVPFQHLYHYFSGKKVQEFDVEAKGEYVQGKPFSPKTNFYKQVKQIEEMLEPELAKYDVVITHDIVFQIAFLVHNQAIRNIADRNLKMKWLHWCHSAPRFEEGKFPHSLRFSGMKNSLWVSPNDSMRPKFAEMYNIPLRQVKYVHHVFDLYRFMDMHPFSIQLIEKHNLLDCDVLCVWATRLDAPAGKGYVKAVRTIAQMNKLCNAKLVFLNSSSGSDKAKATIKILFKEALWWGMPEENLVFSSAEGGIWEGGVPSKVVRDMLWIGNLFILPSQSETFSLAMVEASACKNLLMLNEDLTVMKELAGDNALYGGYGSSWGGETITRHIDNPKIMFMNDAKMILAELQKSKPLMQQRRALHRFSDGYIWKHQMEQLIEGDW